MTRVGLYEEFRKSLIVEIFYAVLSFEEKSHQLSSDVADTLSREVQVKVFYQNLLINLESYNKTNFSQFSDLTNSILEGFISSGFFINSVKSTI